MYKIKFLNSSRSGIRGESVKRSVKCPYCSHEHELDDSWMEDGGSLIHECANCEDEYLITKTEVNELKTDLKGVKMQE